MESIKIEMYHGSIASNILEQVVNTESTEASLRYRYLGCAEQFLGGRGMEGNIEAVLISKKLGKEFVEYTALLAYRAKTTKQLSEYLQNPTITYKDLRTKHNLIDLFSPTNLPKEFIKKLVNMQGRGVGKGEVALITFIKDCENTGGKRGEARGDIKIGSQDIEVKVANAQLVPYDLSGYGTKPVIELQGILGKNLLLGRGRWTDAVQEHFSASNNKEEVLVKINKVIKAFYSDKLPPIAQSTLQSRGLTRYITDNLAKLYIGEGKHIMLIDEISSAYTFLESYEDYLDQVDSGRIVISAFSDKLPRLEYRNR